MLLGDLIASGAVKSIAADLIFSSISLGGAAADKTSLSANQFDGSFATPGRLLTRFTVGEMHASISAAAIDNQREQLFQLPALRDYRSDWRGVCVPALSLATSPPGALARSRSTRSAATRVECDGGGRVDCRRVNQLFDAECPVPRPANSHREPGPERERRRHPGRKDSIWRATTARPRSSGLKTMTVAGNVRCSTFNVKEGNVGTVTVGRFIGSDLFLNYTATTPFNTGGTFDSPTAFKLMKFTTTAVTIGDPNRSLNFAFQGSQIAADTLGTVRLSGLNTGNFGSASGIKFRTAAGSVPGPDGRRNRQSESAATPDLSPVGLLSGDFFFLDV